MPRLATAGWLPVVCIASAGAAAPRIVTEADLLAALNDSHPAVAAAAEAVGLARARAVAAATRENPRLDVVREDPRGQVEQTDWTLSWQLPRSGRRSEVAAAGEARKAAEARLAQELLSLRLEVREIYAAWAVTSARRERLAAEAARVATLADRQRARAERGESSGLAARRLTLAAAALEARLALADAAVDGAAASVKAWYPELPTSATPSLPRVPPPPELAGPHPRVRAAQADLEAASLARRAARHSLRSPELAVGWQRQQAGQDSFEGPILGLAWSLPLFGRNQAARAAADARASAAGARLETVRREIAAGRTAALARYRRLVAALHETEAALEGNARMLAAAEAAFRHGETSLTDLLETQRAVVESEMAALDLHAAALAAHRELERLAGTPDLADAAPDEHPPDRGHPG